MHPTLLTGNIPSFSNGRRVRVRLDTCTHTAPPGEGQWREGGGYGAPQTWSDPGPSHSTSHSSWVTWGLQINYTKDSVQGWDSIRWELPLCLKGLSQWDCRLHTPIGQTSNLAQHPGQPWICGLIFRKLSDQGFSQWSWATGRHIKKSKETDSNLYQPCPQQLSIKRSFTSLF